MKLDIKYTFVKDGNHTVIHVPDGQPIEANARAARKAAEAVAPKGARVTLVEFTEQP